MPLLTSGVLTKLITFWRWVNENVPNAQLQRKEMTILLGQEPVSAPDMKDVITVAAKVPAVARKLKSLGFTAQQEARYRAAVISSEATAHARMSDPKLAVSPTLAANLAFFTEHDTEAKTLLDVLGIPHD
jgi:hypothetical protein